LGAGVGPITNVCCGGFTTIGAAVGEIVSGAGAGVV
jgi:hypothetical protein